MALKLSKEFKSTGVFVEYWKVAQDSVTIRSSKTYPPITPPVDNDMGLGGIDIGIVETPVIQILVYGYLDEDARREEKAPIMSVSATVPCPTTGNFEDERRPLLYYSLKQQAYWADAEDC